jgi:hypothetical protein
MKTAVFAMLQLIALLALGFVVPTTNALVPSHVKSQHRHVESQPSLLPSGTRVNSRTSTTKLHMGGKMSKFGIFSPAVYVAKFALGTDRLNKIRGKAISLHSQYIGDFCEWIGAYHLRTQLIKKAKTNGDILGFLV